ncbi:hypothetical protein MUK42_05387 [Musa troglodytarum]|uniref:Uncharacterized protein n=1 Tax=Musa troglodytarum TaxID=320322 RepID=A0A9E7FH86_9LILI|nr:hypothetical protein MUK42_05387 [Musa troglodytarum]
MEGREGNKAWDGNGLFVALSFFVSVLSSKLIPGDPPELSHREWSKVLPFGASAPVGVLVATHGPDCLALGSAHRSEADVGHRAQRPQTVADQMNEPVSIIRGSASVELGPAGHGKFKFLSSSNGMLT